MIFLKTLKKCKLNNKRQILIVFNDMSADMLNNKKGYPIVN